VESFPDNLIPNPPNEILSMAKPLDIEIRNAAYKWIKAVKEYNYKRGLFTEYNETKEYPTFFIAYAIFNLGDYWDKSIIDSGNKDYRNCINSGMSTQEAYGCFLKSFKERFMYRLYSSPALQEATYNWLLPEWKNAIATMNNERKQLIREILNHSIKYTQNYNYQKELNFFNQCKGEKEHFFTATFPIVNGELVFDSGSNKPYRKVEAWIFRRIHQKHMTAGEINQWLLRIKRDLNI
jgi:hypothetical protein